MMPTAERWPAIRGMDVAAARACCGDSLGLFNRLLLLLQKHYGDWTSVWLAAASANDPALHADLCASLHKLRGSASTMGANQLAMLATQFEQSLKEGKVRPLEAIKRVGEALDKLLLEVGEWQASEQASGA